MALNFPSNPTNGDTYTEASTTWQYDGVAWNVAPSAGGVFPNTFGTVVADGTSLAATNSIRKTPLIIIPSRNFSHIISNYIC